MRLRGIARSRTLLDVRVVTVYTYIATRTSAQAPRRRPPSYTRAGLIAPRAEPAEQRTFPSVRAKGPLYLATRYKIYTAASVISVHIATVFEIDVFFVHRTYDIYLYNIIMYNYNAKNKSDRYENQTSKMF